MDSHDNLLWNYDGCHDKVAITESSLNIDEEIAIMLEGKAPFSY